MAAAIWLKALAYEAHLYSGLLSEIAQCSGVRTPEERERDSGSRETVGIPLDAEIFALGETGAVEVVAKLRVTRTRSWSESRRRRAS